MKDKTKKRTQCVGTATLGSKGQIVIPAQIREMFSFNEGDTLVLLADSKKGLAIVKSDFISEAALKAMKGHD